MLSICLRRGALASLPALMLAAAPGMASAQDGQLPVGPRTTSTDPASFESRRGQIPGESNVNLREVLPPVPATASDPAPPGTRAVRVDTPVPVEGPSAPHPASSEPVSPSPRGVSVGEIAAGIDDPAVRRAEGFVRSVHRPANLDDPDAHWIVTIDTSATWADHQGPSRTIRERVPVPSPRADRETTAEAAPNDPVATAPQSEPKVNQPETAPTPDEIPVPPAIEETLESLSDGLAPAPGTPAPDAPAPLPADLVPADGTSRNLMTVEIPSRTPILVHARTSKGTDLPATATRSTPTTEGGAIRPRATASGGLPTNVTNIREGSYLQVNYRASGDRNRAVSVALIELPLREPATTPGAEVRSGTNVPAATPGGVIREAQETPGTFGDLAPGDGVRRPSIAPAGGQATPEAINP